MYYIKPQLYIYTYSYIFQNVRLRLRFCMINKFHRIMLYLVHIQKYVKQISEKQVYKKLVNLYLILF